MAVNQWLPLPWTYEEYKKLNIKFEHQESLAASYELTSGFDGLKFYTKVPGEWWIKRDEARMGTLRVFK